MNYDVVVIGSGFAGAVIAERFANISKKKVLVIEKRNHIGGICYDSYDGNGLLVNKYGPHIFHTNSDLVFNYLSEFSEWVSYRHKVMAKYKKKYYSIPINRATINKFFNLKLKTDEEVKLFLNSIKIQKKQILTSEDIITSQIGKELFEAFFEKFTKKQWNYYPKELKPGICGRIKVRFDDSEGYFKDVYQVMPKNGYHTLFNNLLDNRNIEIILDADYKKVINNINYKVLIFTGPIDSYYDYAFGKLPYRSIKFKFRNIKKEFYQKYPVVNFVGDEEYSRITEFKRITGQISKSTTICIEYPDFNNDPYYPILNEEGIKLYSKYNKLSQNEKKVFFVGRLATFKYFDMDQTVYKSIKFFNDIKFN